MVNVGDALTVRVAGIAPHPGRPGHPRIILEAPEPGWTATLQYDNAASKLALMLRVGDVVEGWVLRKKNEKRFLAVAMSEEGRFRRAVENLQPYVTALQAFADWLAAPDATEPCPDTLSEIVRLAKGCVTKREWEWLPVYRAWSYADDVEAGIFRGAIEKLRKSIRNPGNRGATERRASSVETLRRGDFGARARVAAQRLALDSGAFIPAPQALDWTLPTTQQLLRDTTLSDGEPDGAVSSVGEHEKEPSTRSELTDIRLERANTAHRNLVSDMRACLEGQGFRPEEGLLIDLLFRAGSRTVIFEMKSVHADNISKQVRSAVSQLYEYRYRHNMPDADLCIVLSAALCDCWLVDYLTNDREILVCWWSGGRFECPASLETKMPWASPVIV